MMTLYTGKKFQAWNRVEHVIFGQKRPKITLNDQNFQISRSREPLVVQS